MMHAKKYTLPWLAAGLLFSLMALLVVWTGLTGKVWVTDPGGIQETADAILNSIHTGDWIALEEMVAGSPSLTPATGEADSAENRIWEAYRRSLQWACEKEFRMQGSTVIQEISVTCLDIRRVTDIISENLSNAGAEQLEPASQAQLLNTAVEHVLESEPPVMQREITLSFQREKGRWVLIPNHALQMLLSGFTAH